MANEFQECSGVPSMPKTRIRPAEYFEIEKHFLKAFVTFALRKKISVKTLRKKVILARYHL